TTYVWDNSVVDGSPFIPGATTTYTVTGTDANGCVNTDVVTVTVQQLPNITVSNNDTICSGSSVNLFAGGAPTLVWLPSTGLNNPNIFNPIATLTSTTTYTVTGTVAGCSNSNTVTIAVNPVPVVSVSNDTTICEGSSLVLYVGGADNYLWNTTETSSSIIISPLITTTYSVIATSLNCSDTANINITVNLKPVVNVNSDTTICAGNSVQLSANGTLALYLWSDSQSGASINVNPTVTTTYTVVGTDANTCTATSSVVVTVNPLPIVNISSLVSDSACVASGQLIHLTGSPFGGTWSGLGVSGNYFNPYSAGVGTQIITYNYTDVNTSCSGSDTKTIEVFDFPVPDSMIITDSTVVFLYSSSQLNYPANLVIIHANESTKHYYFASVHNSGQLAFSGVHVVDGDLMLIEPISPTLSLCVYDHVYIGVNEVLKDEDLKIYPNPFSDILNVEIPEGNYEIVLVDMIGHSVQNMSAEGNFMIHRNNVKAGLYMLQIVSNGKVLSNRKIVIKD
ncbi:MAG: T9SS type A sorting domain-containing protein, partial [Minisyncoccia bacterium]